MAGLFDELGFKSKNVSGLRPTLEVLGDEDVAKALAGIGRAAISESETIALKAAEPLLREIKANAPRDSGDMADSIDLYTLVPRGNLTAVVGIGPEKKYYYWLFLEMGAQPHLIPRQSKGLFDRVKNTFKGKLKHPGVTAQPFIRPAYDKLEDQIVNDIAEGLNAILEKYFGTE